MNSTFSSGSFPLRTSTTEAEVLRSYSIPMLIQTKSKLEITFNLSNDKGWKIFKIKIY